MRVVYNIIIKNAESTFPSYRATSMIQRWLQPFVILHILVPTYLVDFVF